jgi:hypothetical protein
MRLHNRTLKVQAAQCRFNQELLEFQKKQELTDIEMLGIMAGAMQSEFLKYMLRAERHPDDPNKRADEE